LNPKTRILFALGISLMLMFAVGVLLMLKEVEGIRARKGDSLPVLGKVPDFSLVERSGAEISLNDLAGEIWIADFIFTHCVGPCPLLSAQMASLQKKLWDSPSVRLVSVTVDPERDTPELLTDYARRFKADKDRWLFLTGEKEAVYDLVREGFQIPVSEDEDSDQIMHSLRFALVDQSGTVRAYYDGTDPNVAGKVLPDVGALLREK